MLQITSVQGKYTLFKMYSCQFVGFQAFLVLPGAVLLSAGLQYAVFPLKLMPHSPSASADLGLMIFGSSAVSATLSALFLPPSISHVAEATGSKTTPVSKWE